MNFAKVLFSDLTIKESIKKVSNGSFGYINRVKSLENTRNLNVMSSFDDQ